MAALRSAAKLLSLKRSAIGSQGDLKEYNPAARVGGTPADRPKFGSDILDVRARRVAQRWLDEGAADR